MPDSGSLSDLTREQLHELVWTEPATKLAERFGVSVTKVFLRCRKLGVPRPGRGHWAKVEFGTAEKRPDLPLVPPAPEELTAELPPAPDDALAEQPAEGVALHPLAAQFLAAIKKASVSYDKVLVHLEDRELPGAKISKTQAPRVAHAFHALLNLVEPRGVQFKRARSKYDSGCFRKGNDDLHLKIEEELVPKPEKPGRQRSYYSGWQEPVKIAGGRLTFVLSPSRYANEGVMRWTESDKLSLDTIVTEMGKGILRYYVELQAKREQEAVRQEKARIEWEIQRKKEAEAEAIRRQEEARRRHDKTLEDTVRIRQEDLVKAAEWWRIHRGVEDFITECEHRWSMAQAGTLTPVQQAWAAWARETAKSLSPFETGYPDPAQDGAFDPAAYPFEKPYPPKRNFPQPPTMPALPAPVVVQQGYGAPTHVPEAKPYPFWLKYQRR